MTADITPNGAGDPSVISMEFAKARPSLRPQKLIASIDLELRPGLSWSQAEALLRTIEAHVLGFGVRHWAAGE